MADNQATASKTDEHDVETYDPSVAFRTTGGNIALFIAGALIAMSLYHLYASGFGLIRELVHRSVHLSFALGLVFLTFNGNKKI